MVETTMHAINDNSKGGFLSKVGLDELKGKVISVFDRWVSKLDERSH